MKWEKLGKIFDPREYRLPNGCEEFAQSPQALVCTDFVRVFFSTRIKDAGKFLSRVAFVDFEKDFRKVIRVSEEEVISLGNRGCFDEHGIFPLNVVRYGEQTLGFSCGWSRRVSVSVETSIGIAVSENDGATFRKLGEGPVMSSSLNEPCLVGDPFVKFIQGQFHMWYIFGTGWEIFQGQTVPDRTYKIGHAVSFDGIEWERDGLQIVEDVLGEKESQALPTVEFFDGAYHMFFCYRESSDFRKNTLRSYKIGHASSTDLFHWKRNDAAYQLLGTPGDWDSDMQCYPNVFLNEGKIYILYNGNEFGRHGFGLAMLK